MKTIVLIIIVFVGIATVYAQSTSRPTPPPPPPPRAGVVWPGLAPDGSPYATPMPSAATQGNQK